MSNARRGVLRVASEFSGTWVALRGIAQALEFVAWIALARRIPTDVLGHIAIAYLVCRYAALVGDLASPFAGVRMVARGEPPRSIAAMARARERLTLGLTVAVGIGMALSVPELLPLCLVVVFRGADRDWMALGQGREAAAGANPMLASASLVIAAFATSTPTAFALVVGMGHLVAVASSWRLNPIGHERADLPSTIRGASWLTAVLVGDQVYQSSDVFVVGVVLGASHAGIYSTLYRFPAAWLAVVGLVSSGWLRSATVRSVTDEGHRQNIRVAKAVGRVGLLAVIVLVPTVWFLVPPLLGSPFDQYRGTAVVLAVAAGFATMCAPMATVHMTRESDRHLATVSATLAVANLGGCILMVPRFGLIGAATMTLVAYLGLSSYYGWTLFRVREPTVEA